MCEWLQRVKLVVNIIIFYIDDPSSVLQLSPTFLLCKNCLKNEDEVNRPFWFALIFN